MRLTTLIAVCTIAGGALLAQPAETRPKFDAASIHTAAPSTTVRFMRGGVLHGERFEIKGANMVELISSAYSVDQDKVLGGPTWIEMDRFDILAKAPAKTPPQTLNLMLQSLLAERFQLKAQVLSKPMPAFALTAGKHPLIKAADGSEPPGCTMTLQRPQAAPATDGGPAMVALQGNNTLQMACHNTTMPGFADQIRGWVQSDGSDGNRLVVDQTGLAGAWNFDLKIAMNGTGPEAVQAVEKQLGLKLESATLPTPVIQVESVSAKPTPDSPETTKIFPPLPTEFDVAEIKPFVPDPGTQTAAARGGALVAVAGGGRGGRGGAQLQNGRVTMQGFTLRSLIMLAWDLNSDDMLVGAPKWFDTDRFTVIGKAPGGPAADAFNDIDSVKPLLRKLLTERFKLAIHSEDRPVNGWVLTASKPKLKQADPQGRTRFFEGPGADGKDPRVGNSALTRLVTCQNMTMAQFVSLLPTMASGYFRGTTVANETGLEGAWDFTVAFSAAGLINGGGGRGGDAPAAGGTASDPSGGISLPDAISKQLGLKLEMQKRPMPVMVIDHVEQTPTEN